MMMMANEKLRRAMDIARTINTLRSDDVLAALGLQRRRTLIEQLGPALGGFTVGVAVGAGLGVLLAPSSGEDLRRQLLGRAERLGDRLAEKVNRSIERRRPSGDREEQQRIEAERSAQL
jgi:hypothetical protein